MRNGKWYLAYTKTVHGSSDTEGSCGGVSSGFCFTEDPETQRIPLKAGAVKKAMAEGKRRWKKICADIEIKWEERKEAGESGVYRCRDYPHKKHEGFLYDKARNPRVIYEEIYWLKK